MRRPHLFSFVIGLGCTALGVLALLWALGALTGALTAGLVPGVLIVLGIAGLVMARITPATRNRKENHHGQADPTH